MRNKQVTKLTSLSHKKEFSADPTKIRLTYYSRQHIRTEDFTDLAALIQKLTSLDNSYHSWLQALRAMERAKP